MCEIMAKKGTHTLPYSKIASKIASIQFLSLGVFTMYKLQAYFKAASMLPYPGKLEMTKRLVINDE